MSIGAISSSTTSNILDSTSNSGTNQMAQEWKDLESALKSGDLTSAKTAFQAIEKLHEQQVSQSGSTASISTSNSTGSTSASSNSTSNMDSAMAALGEALDSGDLSAAQSAFANAKAVMKNGPPPPPPQTSSSSSSSNNEDAVIVSLLSTLESSSSSSTSSSSSSQTISGKLNVSV